MSTGNARSAQFTGIFNAFASIPAGAIFIGAGAAACYGDPFGTAQTPHAKSGDGTVPWFSAFPIEWEDDSRALAAPGKHALQSAANVVDTITDRLKPDAIGRYKGSPVTDESVIELRLSSPVIAQDGTLEVQVRTRRDGRLKATLTHMPTGKRRSCPIDARGGTVQFEKLEEGVHRIEVGPNLAGLITALHPVSDYVLVLSNG
jgi:hypothetical protein